MKKFLPLLFSLLPLCITDAQSLLQVPGQYTDAVYNVKDNWIYAVTASTDSNNGNSVCRINPQNGEVEACYFVGSSPSVIALTDNGKYLYIGFSGEASIKRFDLNNNETDLSFPAGGESDFLGPFYAEEILPLPNSTDAIAVSLRNLCCSPRHEGVFIFRNGVPDAVSTPDHTGSNSITYTDREDQLIGYNNETTDFGLRQMSVNGSGIMVGNTYQFLDGFYNRIEYRAGRVYSTNGQFVNINNGIVSTGGRFSDDSFGFSRMGVEAVPAVDRVFFFGRGDSGYELLAYHINTLTLQNSWSFPDAAVGDVVELMQLDNSGNRFAVVDEHNALLLISICVSAFTEVPPAYKGPNSFCVGDSLVLLAPAAARAAGEISWSDGRIGDSIVVNVPGTYAYAILDASGCPGPFSDNIQISNVFPPDRPSLQYNEATNTLASSYTGGRNLWYHNDVLEAETDTRFYQPLQSGFYSVRAEGTACLSEASDLVSVVVTSVNGLRSASGGIALSPNPAHDHLKVLFSDQVRTSLAAQPVEVSVWSITGQQLIRQPYELNGESLTLDISTLSAGHYVLLVRAGGRPLLRKLLAKL